MHTPPRKAAARLRSSLALFVLLAAGCSDPRSPRKNEPNHPAQTEKQTPIVEADATVVDLLPAYPRARWRLAGSALDSVVLFASHIVIRYQGADVLAGVQRFPQWQPLPPVARSRAEARSLALMLEGMLKREPARFSELARRYSDDVVTRELGGTLGAAWTAELSMAYLDAIAALAPNQVSRAFETADGFHLLRRDVLPDLEQVSGERITLAYRTACPRYLATSERGREQAIEMAEKLLLELRRDPSKFGALADQFSESNGTDVGRKTGNWSTREPGFSALEVVALSRIAVGELTGPIDTPAGLQLLRRLPLREQPSYAMHALRLPHPASLPAADRWAAEQELVKVRAELERNPASFDALRLRHCCTAAELFSAARSLEGVERALSSMKVGELSTQPVYTDLEVFFLKRLDPATASAPEPFVFELPADAGPKVDELLVHADGKAVAHSLRQFTSAARQTLRLDEKKGEAFERLVERMAQTVESASIPRRKTELVRFKGELAQLLGAQAFLRYTAYADQWATEALLHNQHAPTSPEGT
jgi:hypothetical protein